MLALRLVIVIYYFTKLSPNITYTQLRHILDIHGHLRWSYAYR